MILGLYYLSLMSPNGLGEDMIFSSMEELLIAIDQKNVSLGFTGHGFFMD